MIFISILVAPTSAAILLKSTLYDGWRQFYFVYPALVYLAVYGYAVIAQKCEFSRALRSLVAASLFILVGLTAAWMIRNHPFQNVYFNLLAGSSWAENFEGDYWGLSNTSGLQFIADSDSREKIYIFGLGNTSIPQALLMLPDGARKRFVMVDSVEHANYVLTNFRLLNRSADMTLLDSISSR